ncbi:muscle M-line assembly protein unc-89 [Scheffersomyces amazonensis]|uniref:muscle M-line assembly protein unc-89 n=1 Tax=Scheffersomyces amazonensis TaxID=1078765 RepID=UPI00315DCF43
MTEISPSSTKVDDFLSSLSQISQERLREDQQRQNVLRRNINELKSNSAVSSPSKPGDIPSYSFTPATYKIINSSPTKKEPFRSSRYTFDEDEVEEDAPKLPARPSADDDVAPPLPARREQNSFEVNLLQPKARVEPPKISKLSKPNLPTKSSSPLSNKSDGYRSFSQIEASIKNSQPKPSIEPTYKKTAPLVPTKLPKTPTKLNPNGSETDWMSSLAKSKVVSPSTINNAPKPSYQTALWATQNAKITNKLSEAAKPELKKPPTKPSYLESRKQREAKEDVPPPKPTRPTVIPKLAVNEKVIPVKPAKPVSKIYEEKDSELLKSTISKLSSTKVPPLKPSKPSVDLYTKSEKDILSTVKSSLSSKSAPLKASKPNLSSYSKQDSEELKSQLQRLKPTKPPIVSAKPSATNDIIPALKPRPVPTYKSKTVNLPVYEQDEQKQKSTSSLTVVPTKEGTFEDKLSSILRASTLPETKIGFGRDPPIRPIGRSSTEPTKQEKREDTTNSKGITHVSKSRAKGPKRRLPKSMQTKNTTNETKSVSVPVSKPEAEPEPDSESEVASQLSIPKSSKKVPPPINKLAKPKTVGELKPSRNFSGEVFI